MNYAAGSCLDAIAAIKYAQSALVLRLLCKPVRVVQWYHVRVSLCNQNCINALEMNPLANQQDSLNGRTTKSSYLKDGISIYAGIWFIPVHGRKLSMEKAREVVHREPLLAM